MGQIRSRERQERQRILLVFHPNPMIEQLILRVRGDVTIICPVTLHYRARNKGLHILLSNSQAGPGRNVKQEQEEISRNHVQAFIPGSVHRSKSIESYNRTSFLEGGSLKVERKEGRKERARKTDRRHRPREQISLWPH